MDVREAWLDGFESVPLPVRSFIRERVSGLFALTMTACMLATAPSPAEAFELSSGISLGPSLSIYSMPVCGVVICNQVAGVAPGGHAQTDWYFAEPMGVSVSANLAWAGGSSRVLPGSLVAMVTAGPIWRFGGESR